MLDGRQLLKATPAAYAGPLHAEAKPGSRTSSLVLVLLLLL
jgi:hypothetical protein